MSEKEINPGTDNLGPNDLVESVEGAENTARSAEQANQTESNQQSPQAIPEDQVQTIVEPGSDLGVVQATDPLQATTGVDPLTQSDLLQEEELAENTETSQTATTLNSSPLSGISMDQFNQLTKRSKQFMLDVDKSLSVAEMQPAAKNLVYTEMVETLIEGQQSSQTARQLYGTPTETANVILEQEIRVQEEANQSPDWQVALDGGLMLGSIFTLITGFAAFLGSREGAQPAFLMGLVTLIINYLAAGFSMLQTAKVLPDPEAPKGEKGYGKYFLVSTLTMILWIAAVMLTQIFLPSAINPLLPPIAYIIIAVVTFGARYLVKRYYKIEGGLF